MDYAQLAERLLKSKVSESEILEHFSYKGKHKIKDIEKHVRNTVKVMGTKADAAAIKYLASLLTLALRQKKTA